LYFSHPLCEKGQGLTAENTHGRLQRWRRTYRSSLVIVQCFAISRVELVPSHGASLRRHGDKYNIFSVSIYS
jgi:hypothetical protein